MITSLLFSIRQNLALLLLGGLAMSAVGCNTSNLMTYAEDARHKGMKQFEAQDYQGAAGSFTSATHQDPRDYKSFYYLGACYDALGSHQQAAQAHQSSLKVMDVTLEGKQDKAFRARTIDGLAIALAKGHDRAATIGMPTPGKKPAEDAWLLAKVSRYTGDADAAVEAYKQASLHEPDNFYITKDYALYLEELGQASDADLELRRAYRMNDKDPEILAALRRIGVEPGPALKEQRDLAKPIVPRGPIPEVKLKMPRIGGGQPAETAAPAEPAPAAPPAAPRD